MIILGGVNAQLSCPIVPAYRAIVELCLKTRLLTYPLISSAELLPYSTPVWNPLRSTSPTHTQRPPDTPLTYFHLEIRETLV